MGKSRTYRGCNVQSVNVEVLLQGRAGQEAVVGVDVGKEKLYLVLRWPDGQTAPPVVVSQPEQLGVALEFLQGLAAGRKLRVALEPSGTYGDAFRYACHRAGLAVERVSPVASSRHAEVYDASPSQHDGKDAGVIAELAAIGKSSPWLWQLASEQEQMVAAHAALMDDCQQEVNAWRSRLEAKLARHWPEVSGLLELSGTTLLEALIYYQSPTQLAEDEKAAERLAAWGGPFLKPDKIAAVVQSVRTTKGVPVGVGESYHLVEIARHFLASKRQLEIHHQALENLGVGLRAVQVAGATLGKATMAVLHVEAGDPGAYRNGRSYLKALGLNLVERSSGQYQGRLHISKRGSSVARRWLYMAALRVVKKPGIKEWYEAKVQRDGGKKGKALMGVMRKLALGLEHCCRTGEEFSCGEVFQDKRHKKRRSRRRHRGRGRSTATACGRVPAALVLAAAASGGGE